MADESCPNCGGTGWVIAEREGLSGAERCQCYGQRRTAERQNRAGIPPQFGKATLQTFQIPDDNPIARTGLSTIHVKVRTYANTYPLTDKLGLLFVGATGTGKTHLAVAAMKILMLRGFDCVFFDYQTLLERIQRSWNPTAGAADRDAYRQALETDIVLIDDLGARRASDWVEDTVTSIITQRYNEQKPIIVTTNLPIEPDRIEDQGKTRLSRSLAEVIGERSRSRLFEMCHVVKMPAVEDYRLKRR
jgi:DNA replication protein DnaC